MLGQELFKGKKITVMRIGLLGRGIGDTAYIAEAGAEVLVVDSASQAVMQPAVDALAEYPNITFKFGPYDFADFKDADMVIVGAGAPLDEPVLVEAKKAGVSLKQSAALFAEISGVPIIGVTGTRGKSTVTLMIHHVLSMVTEGAPVLLGGNIRGVSNLQLLKEVKEDSLCVMELDSWQLQGFGWAEISPQVAVFTSFMPDHMNYYHDDMDLYFKDKANIYLYQEDSGVLITTPDVFTWIQKLSGTLGQELILADASAIPEDCLLAMPGEHNRLNAALAYEALKATGLTDEEIFDGLASFPGVPGRLEYLGSHNGIKIYNDNNATTPTATAVGIKAVAENKNVILIMGGADKGLDIGPLIEALDDNVKSVIILPGTGSDNLRQELETTEKYSTVNRTIFQPVSSLKEAVEAGLAKGQPGDVLLFSPAFASFGMYKNEYERNDEFVEIIKSLENETK
ncbi:MAG: UDP-N-acetylmuramoyl-L-alanine--D-glutamate ligase [Candidatus Paceibacterota bacterium]